jgi:hypothetical protein
VFREPVRCSEGVSRTAYNFSYVVVRLKHDSFILAVDCRMDVRHGHGMTQTKDNDQPYRKNEFRTEPKLYRSRLNKFIVFAHIQGTGPLPLLSINPLHQASPNTYRLHGLGISYPMLRHLKVLLAPKLKNLKAAKKPILSKDETGQCIANTLTTPVCLIFQSIPSDFLPENSTKIKSIEDRLLRGQ